MQVSMPLTTNFAIPPVTAAMSQVTNDGQSFSSMMHGAEVKVAPSASSPELGRTIHPEGSPASVPSADKSSRRQIESETEGTTVHSTPGQEPRTTLSASNAAVQDITRRTPPPQAAHADVADQATGTPPNQPTFSPGTSTGPEENGTASQSVPAKPAASERTWSASEAPRQTKAARQPSVAAGNPMTLIPVGLSQLSLEWRALPMTDAQLPPSTQGEPVTEGSALPQQTGSTQLAGTAAFGPLQSLSAVPISLATASNTVGTDEATQGKSEVAEASAAFLGLDAAQKADDSVGATLLPRATAAPVVSPPQVGSHEAKPVHFSGTDSQPGLLKVLPPALHTSLIDTLKTSASGSAASSDPVPSTKLLTSAFPAPNATGLQVEALTSSPIGLPAPSVVLPGGPSDANATVAAQADNGISPTPAATRRDKAQGGGSATVGETPDSSRTGVAAQTPTLAKTIEGPASAVEVATRQDPNTALTSSAQTTQKALGHDGGQAAGTVGPDPDSVGGGGMGGLTQARVLHGLAGSEMHINLNSEEFGRVSVHTAYGREVITSQISLENSVMGNALSSALNAHLPTLETKLGQEHGLSSSVTLAMQTGGENRGADRNQNNDSHSQSHSSGSSGQASQQGAGFATSSLSADTVLSAGQSASTPAEASSGRLDIRI